MGKIVNSTFVSLDGVINHMDRWHFDFIDAESEAFALRQLQASRALLMGRHTYGAYAGAWPGRDGDMADRINAMTKYVASTTLHEPAPRPPAGYPAPTQLAYENIRARAISRADLDNDVRGINASLDLIRRTRGGCWPTEPVTAEFNYVDLVWHECEFREGDSFTYAVYDTDDEYLGCCYLNPLGRRTPLTEELLDYEVDVSWWVTPHAAWRVDAVDWDQVQESSTTRVTRGKKTTVPRTGLPATSRAVTPVV